MYVKINNYHGEAYYKCQEKDILNNKELKLALKELRERVKKGSSLEKDLNHEVIMFIDVLYGNSGIKDHLKQILFKLGDEHQDIKRIIRKYV